MSRNRTSRLLVLLVACACIFGAYRLVGSFFADDAKPTAADNLANQVWIDHLPEDSRDMVSHLVLISDDGVEVGATGMSSQWRHWLEIFFWRLEGDRLTVFFPQEQGYGEVDVETWHCEGEAPEPFELCLRLSNDQGDSIMFYSLEDWTIDGASPGASLDALIAAQPALSGVADNLRAIRSSEFDSASATDWRKQSIKLSPLSLQ